MFDRQEDIRDQERYSHMEPHDTSDMATARKTLQALTDAHIAACREVISTAFSADDIESIMHEIKHGAQSGFDDATCVMDEAIHRENAN